MIIVSILIYLFFSLFVSISVYGRLNFPKFVQLFFLITFGLNIFIYFGLDLLKAIDKPYLFLFLQILLCALLANVIGRRWPLSPQDFQNHLKISFSDIKWFDYLLMILISAVLFAFFVVGITTPPNNMDSLDPTGITRIFFWIQQGSLDYGSPAGLASIFDPQLFHIQGLWLFSLSRSEYLFFLVQWFSCVVSTVTIFRISRSLGFSITNSLLSAVVGLALPVVLMQTYSFQGDLTVAVFIFVCISFVMDWFILRRKLDLLAAGLAFIFALGSKRAAFLAIPAFGLFILFWFISKLKNKKIIPWVNGSTAIFLVAGILIGGQMIYHRGGTFAGIPIIYEGQAETGNIVKKTQYNSARFLYQFVGLDGLPRALQNEIIPIKAKLFRNNLGFIYLELQKPIYLQPGFDEVEKFSFTSPLILSEEGAWFGPIGFLLIPITVIFALVSKQKRRRIYTIFVLVFFLSFFVMVIIQRPGWDPYQGRYFILPILPLIPLVSVLFPTNKLLRLFLIVFILPVCLFLSFNTFFANNSRPVITAGSIWGYQYQHILTLPENNKYQRFFKNKLITSFDQIATDALDRRTIYQSSYWEQVYYSGFRMLGNIQFIDPLIPDGATLYLDLPSTALDYGLFGKNKDRTLLRVNDISQVPSGYFLTKSPLQGFLSKEMTLLGDNGTYQIYLIKNP